MGPSLDVVRAYDYGVHDEIARRNSGVKGRRVEATDRDERVSVFQGSPVRIDRVAFVDEEGNESAAFRMWESLRIRVHYSCPGEIPEPTLGMAVAINREHDLLSVCQFSTARVTRDTELRDYDGAPYRRRAGRSGVLEARLAPLQLADGDYIVSVGILPNAPNVVEFYDYHHYHYRITIVRDGSSLAGTVFYPVVSWRHQLPADAEATSA